MSTQARTFTRSIRKIVLTKDVPNLGFKGEICFVKPGRAFNTLLPREQCIMYTDPAAKIFMKGINTNELALKQQERRLEMFLAKLS